LNLVDLVPTDKTIQSNLVAHTVPATAWPVAFQSFTVHPINSVYSLYECVTFRSTLENRSLVGDYCIVLEPARK